jgi:hypothetical protein
MDPLLIELSRPCIPAYGEALDEARTLVDYEHAWSGLSDEYERRRLTVIYTADEYARLERAIAEERCAELVYASDGLRIRGYVARPPRNRPPCPVVLLARGGNRHFGSISPLTLLDFVAVAERGYLVVGTQYRGGPDSKSASHILKSDSLTGHDETVEEIGRRARPRVLMQRRRQVSTNSVQASKNWEPCDDSTEDLRVALTRYRSFFNACIHIDEVRYSATVTSAPMRRSYLLARDSCSRFATA